MPKNLSNRDLLGSLVVDLVIQPLVEFVALLLWPFLVLAVLIQWGRGWHRRSLNRGKRTRGRRT